MAAATENLGGQMSIKKMFEKAAPQTNGTTALPTIPAGKKKKAVEEIYQLKTQLEHILLRPDSYIGSVEANTELMWVYDAESSSIVQKEVTYVPGLYKIYDEILVNAADHKQKDPAMDTIKVEIDQTNNVISVWNNGKGIPIVMHKVEKMFVPTMIFGHLLTSSNFDDEEQKVTGGRNGYGAKLANIFSSKFTAETACKSSKKNFKQIWSMNMSKTTEPKIRDFSGSEFTKITFSPDLSKFKMTSLDDDIVSIMSRRAYDVAASARGVKVFLNGKKIPVKNFKEYVDLFIRDKVDDMGGQIKCAYEMVNDRWEVAVTLSDKGFQQMSFVNSIATTKGGRHVDYVTDAIVKNFVENLKKKNKSGVNIKPFQVKSHMWVFVNCLIVNPTFDSQTKENMTLQAKSFGSRCAMSEKFITAATKCGIVEAVMSWAKFKQQAQLQSKCAGKKHTKIKGIPKLEDANDAGTRYSSECTLILTEGDSAKTLAVAGLSVVGRDRYGVFPLKGKLLNVREATHKQILENAEINNVIKILGLQYKKKYENEMDIKTLRYGKLMIMTDQDQDGSHIKGLLINFIHHNWPSLLRLPFLEEFITPIVKATKAKEGFSFYSLPEFEEWKKSTDNWHTYKIKYYKGLGTSTSKEAKEYFQDMMRHRIFFKHEGTQDDHAITMAFSKKAVDQRKEWLTSWMVECKRRKELGLPDIYLYEKNTKSVNYSDFVNKELVLFSNLDNERSLPCLVDGLKPGQRKVLYTCFKRNDKKEIKVAQLAGSVAEHSAYHHGEASLMSTIINLAQNYVGSNNINLLKPIGQFGTRLQGGKDAASPRYIFTQLSSLARFIFHVDDEPVLNFLKDDNQKIEPEWYIPIIPMVLINGAEGIGTGWSTKVPNYNPREVVKNIKRMIRGEEPLPMKPWFKNFRGEVESLEYQRFLVSGEVAKLTHNKYEISELPIKTWTQAYKEGCMEPLLIGSEKCPALISDYREYHTDTTVRFVVTVPEDKVDKLDDEGPHKVFKLQTTIALSSMVLFDHVGCLKKYNDPLEILREFFALRVTYYEKRKKYLTGLLEAEASKLSNQARFILEKCDGRLTVENKKRRDMISELQRKGYDSDPIKAWKSAHNREALLEEEGQSDNEEDELDSEAADYDYLLGMPMWNLTKEKKDEILKKRDEKVHELAALNRKSSSDLWEDDLNAFLEELEIVEQKEKEDDSGDKKGKQTGGKRKKLVAEVLPSPTAERIAPKIDAEIRRKVEKANQAKEKGKKVKREVVEDDEFDDLVNTSTSKSLAARIGNSPDQIEKSIKRKKPSKDGLKQTKLNFKRKGKRKVSDDEDDDDNSDPDSDFIDDVGTELSIGEVQPRERAAGRRAAAANIKFKFGDDEVESEESDLEFHDNIGIEERHHVVKQHDFDDSVAEENKKINPSSTNVIDVSDTDSEFEVKPSKVIKPIAPAKKAAADQPSASEMFDSLLGSSPPPAASDHDSVKEPAKHFNDISDSEGSDNYVPSFEDRVNAKLGVTSVPASLPKPKATAEPKTKKNETEPKTPTKKVGPKKTAAAKRKTVSDSDDDFFEQKPSSKKSKPKAAVASDSETEVAPRQTVGRAKKSVKYNFSESESDDY